MIDAFQRSLDHRGLQRHMLAVPPDTLTAAVTTAEDYLQIGGSESRYSGRPAVRVVEEPEEPEDRLDQVLQAIQKQTECLGQLMTFLSAGPTAQSGGERQAPSSGRRKLECYNCGGGHMKRNCPQLHRGAGAKPDTVRQVQGKPLNEQGSQE